MRKVCFLVATVLLVPAAGSAAPVDLKQVSAEATWVVHVDVDALRDSTFVQKTFKRLLETNPDAGKRLDQLRRDLGMDPRKDLHGLTLYGRRLGQNEGVVILVHAEFNQKVLLDRLKWAPDHKTAAYRSYELQRWTDAKGQKNEHPVCGVFSGPGTAIVSSSFDELRTALDVLDGERPSLAGRDSPLAAAVPDGAAVVARTVGLAESALPLKSPLLTQSETFSFAAGEKRGTLFAEARLTTKSAETTRQVRSILDGVRAMVELQHGQDPEVGPLVRKLEIRAVDKSVEVEFHAPPDEVWALLGREWKKPLLKPAGDPEKK